MSTFFSCRHMPNRQPSNGALGRDEDVECRTQINSVILSVICLAQRETNGVEGPQHWLEHLCRCKAFSPWPVQGRGENARHRQCRCRRAWGSFDSAQDDKVE